MAAGEITPDEAVTVTRMLDGRREALNAFKLERELTRFHGDFIDGDELFRPAAERFREPDEIAAAADEDAAAGNESEDAMVETHALTEPSPPGRGQGEGWRSAYDSDDSAAASSPHPDPLPHAGEGIAVAAAEIEPSPLGPFDKGSGGQDEGWRSAYDSDALHSACIEQDLQARAAARRSAERKLAQWSYLIATEPGFDAEAFIAAEIQRSAALNRSSAALPGQSSPSPRALNGVSTVLR
jgi:hypothetical protein